MITPEKPSVLTLQFLWYFLFSCSNQEKEIKLWYIDLLSFLRKTDHILSKWHHVSFALNLTEFVSHIGSAKISVGGCHIMHLLQEFDCGTNIGCLRNPAGCVFEDCDFFVSWRPETDVINFNVSVTVTNGDMRWAGLGFSLDGFMVQILLQCSNLMVLSVQFSSNVAMYSV